MTKIPVGIIGATGIVGQNYLSLLAEHPLFEITFLAASEKSANKSYAEAVKNRWHQNHPIPIDLSQSHVYDVEDIDQAAKQCKVVFSALGGGDIKHYEEEYARNGLVVVSNASAHRHTPDVPMIIPEINAHHLDIIPIQQKKRHWEKGFIIVKPNCSLQSYMTPLFVLHQAYGLKEIIITTMQAVSGAGHPGVSSLDIIDNIVPFIPGEEEKSEREPLKILGSIKDDVFAYCNDINITAHCNRVPVLNGHLACVSVKFLKKPPSVQEILTLWKNFKGIDLPSAPKNPITYCDKADRPQPRLDRDNDKGMTITVGRLRECNVFDYRFVGLSHNTLRGAAGGGILNAELLAAKKLI